MKTFTSSRQLQLWLGEQGIDLSLWGEGEAKSVADLWLEMVNGETTLHESPPRRQVQVVELLIEHNGQFLIEAMQEFANGERRYRKHLPAEKIKRGEDALMAARRCLLEEFSLTDLQLETIRITIEQTVEKERRSPSYPGLNTTYLLHRVRIENFDFPSEDFATENQAHDDGDPVKAHHWQWTTTNIE